MTAEQTRAGRARTVPALWWVAAAFAGLAVLALASWYGGGIVHSRVTGLPDAGRITAWGCRSPSSSPTPPAR